MKKRTIGVVLAVAVVIIVGVIIWGIKQPNKTQNLTSSSQENNQQADIIFYYGQECPHCQNVEKFITDNQINQKVIFAKKEVWHNTDNSNELQEKAKECALDLDKVGVPFLFARGKCYVGEIEVENFFKKEAGIQ